MLGVAVVAWWVVLITEAVQGRAPAIRAALLVVVYRAVLMNGIAALAAAPRPSAAFPYQDISHAASLGLGLVAARSLVSTVGPGTIGRRVWQTLGLLLLDSAVGGFLMVSNL